MEPLGPLPLLRLLPSVLVHRLMAGVLERVEIVDCHPLLDVFVGVVQVVGDGWVPLLQFLVEVPDGGVLRVAVHIQNSKL